MPSYSITQSPYFDTFGPFERALIHLQIESSAEEVDPPPALTSEPGEQWLSLVWSLVGGRHVGIFGSAGDTTLATMAKTNVQAISEIRRWLRAIKRSFRYDAVGYLETGFTLWVLPAPFPRTMPLLLEDIGRMQDDEAELTQPSATLLNALDELFDLGAMYWRLEPGHQILRLETRFVGTRDLERHLSSTSRMAGVDLWPVA